MVLSVPMSEPRHAMFPARVTLHDGTVYEPCRVATDTAGVTRAWAWDHTQWLPIEVGHWKASDLIRTDGKVTGRPRVLTAPDGTVLDGSSEWCGCGHPLKTWRPALVAPQG